MNILIVVYVFNVFIKLFHFVASCIRAVYMYKN